MYAEPCGDATAYAQQLPHTRHLQAAGATAPPQLGTCSAAPWLPKGSRARLGRHWHTQTRPQCAGPEARGPRHEMTTFLLTIDVESRAHGDPRQDVLGVLPGHRDNCGVGLMMDMLEAGLRTED